MHVLFHSVRWLLVTSPFNNFLQKTAGVEIEIHFWLNKIQRRDMKLLECRWCSKAGASGFVADYFSELQGRHIYVLWGGVRKLSKYYEIWVGRLNPSVINIICHHLVLVWNEELLEWGTYEGSNKHLCRLLPNEFDSKSPGPKMEDFQNLFQKSWLCFLRHAFFVEV